MATLDRYPDGDWSRIAHDDPNARVCRFRFEKNIRAVRIKNGSYRNAPVSGIFELYDSDVADPVFLYKGAYRVKVMCAWLGYKPSQSCARVELKSKKVEVLENYTGNVVDNIGYRTDPAPLAGHAAVTEEVPPLPEEIAIDQVLTEGAKSQIVVNAYERNPEARRKCIEHYGTRCAICKFDFGRVYGDLASGYIHVHHIKPLSEIGERYEVDPISDLRPVCPNCHAVIHLNCDCRSLDEVKKLITLAKSQCRVRT